MWFMQWNICCESMMKRWWRCKWISKINIYYLVPNEGIYYLGPFDGYITLRHLKSLLLLSQMKAGHLAVRAYYILPTLVNKTKAKGQSNDYFKVGRGLVKKKFFWFSFQSVYNVYYGNNETLLKQSYCNDFDDNLGYFFTIYQLVVCFALPALIMILCYSVVIRVLWKSTKTMSLLTNSGSVTR